MRSACVITELPIIAPDGHVSIDIDVRDLSLIPGCVSPEPNGMTYAELRDTLAAIAEHCDVVGLDLAEVNPTLDVGTGVTSYLATHTVLEFLRKHLSPAAVGAPPRGPGRGARLRARSRRAGDGGGYRLLVVPGGDALGGIRPAARRDGPRAGGRSARDLLPAAAEDAR